MKKKIVLALILAICLTTVVSTALAYSSTHSMDSFCFIEKRNVQTTVHSDSSGRVRVYVNAKTYDTDDSDAIPQTDKPQSFRVASKDNLSGDIVSFTSFGKAVTWSTTVTIQGLNTSRSYTLQLQNATRTQYIRGSGTVWYGQ